MGSMIKLASSAAVCLCVATVLSQTIGILSYWTTHGLDRRKLQQIVAILNGVDMVRADTVRGEHSMRLESRQVSYEELLERRVAESLDFDLREQAMGKGLSDLRSLGAKLAEDTRRFNIRREAFKEELRQLEEGAKGNAITEVRLTLEAMRARQAKDQMVRMLKDGEMTAVVSIIKTMPPDKKKKLLAEFRTGDEPDRLGEILKQILRGIPETSVIEAAQNDLSEPQP